MRLAYIFDQRLPSTETDTEQALNTLAALSRNGVEVTLYLPKDTFRHDADADVLRDYYQVSGEFEVKRLRSTFPAPRVLEKVGHAVRASIGIAKAEYDVIYTRNAPALVAGLVAGLPMVYETYRPWPEQVRSLRPVFRWAMRQTNFVGGVFHSEFALNTYAALGADRGALQVVHNGFDPTRFTIDPGAAKARVECGLETNNVVAAYTGRVNLQKGLGVVLDLADRHPDVTFLIVGSEGQGEVEKRAAEQENVVVYPWATYDQLPTYLFAADILMVPPSQGPLKTVGNTVLPMKLFQYLAAGRAIYAPEAPDTAELLTHNENAWLVPPDDLESASSALTVLADNPDLRARLGMNGKEMSSGLTWDARARRIVEFLGQRLQEKT